ncbi:hypothetical protein GALL_345160 [mine drainage metagenome]|uniref:Uncharacterized protein n=1 Tax=mine drainage metagenome TaxID=410659 RepID=A0A1J5R1Q9_9ZZZZ
MRVPEVVHTRPLGEPGRIQVRLAIGPPRVARRVERRRPRRRPEARRRDLRPDRVGEQQLIWRPPRHERQQHVHEVIGQRHRPPRPLRLRRPDVPVPIGVALPRLRHPQGRRPRGKVDVPRRQRRRLTPPQPGGDEREHQRLVVRGHLRQQQPELVTREHRHLVSRRHRLRQLDPDARVVGPVPEPCRRRHRRRQQPVHVGDRLGRQPLVRHRAHPSGNMPVREGADGIGPEDRRDVRRQLLAIVRPRVRADTRQQVDVLGHGLEHRRARFPDRFGNARRLGRVPAGGLDELLGDARLALVVVRQRRLASRLGIAPQHRERACPVGPPTLPHTGHEHKNSHPCQRMAIPVST